MAKRLCKAGSHPMTAANTYVHPQKGPECRACKREYMLVYMRSRRAKLARAAAAAERKAKRKK